MTEILSLVITRRCIKKKCWKNVKVAPSEEKDRAVVNSTALLGEATCFLTYLSASRKYQEERKVIHKGTSLYFHIFSSNNLSECQELYPVQVWHIFISYSKTLVRAQGVNAFPSQVETNLNCAVFILGISSILNIQGYFAISLCSCIYVGSCWGG